MNAKKFFKISIQYTSLSSHLSWQDSEDKQDSEGKIYVWKTVNLSFRVSSCSMIVILVHVCFLIHHCYPVCLFKIWWIGGYGIMEMQICVWGFMQISSGVVQIWILDLSYLMYLEMQICVWGFIFDNCIWKCNYGFR